MMGSLPALIILFVIIVAMVRHVKRVLYWRTSCPECIGAIGRLPDAQANHPSYDVSAVCQF